MMLKLFHSEGIGVMSILPILDNGAMFKHEQYWVAHEYIANVLVHTAV